MSGGPVEGVALPSVTRRTLLKVAGAAAVSMALAPRAVRAAPEPVVLTYRDPAAAAAPLATAQVLAAFSESHPTIRVRLVPEGTIPAESVAGSAPDVFVGPGEVLTPLARQGQLLDLRRLAAADPDLQAASDWDPAQLRGFATAGGVQFALPKHHGALALFYNKDLFNELHVPYPDATWTCDDYLAAMQRLAGKRGSRRLLPWASAGDLRWERLQVYANSWGGHFVDPDDAGRCLMGDSEALAAQGWLRDRIWQDGVMPTPRQLGGLSARDVFTAGFTAMVEEGSWALPEILARAGFRVGVAPFPAGPARRVMLALGDGLAINARTKAPDAAWELVRYLAGRGCGRALASTTLLQPPRASLLESWEASVRAAFPDRCRGLDLAAFAQGQLRGYSVVPECFPEMDAARRLAGQGWEQVLALGRAPVSLMRQVSRDIEAAQQLRVRP